MIPYYEELNDEEKNAVTKVIRTLLKQTFVLERKYDKKSGRLVYNKEFRTIDLHQEFLREYFKISGIELRERDTCSDQTKQCIQDHGFPVTSAVLIDP